MPRRNVPLLRGGIYHLYNRGANRDVVFHEPDDYLVFLQRLRRYVAGVRAILFAYVLMPNHYHLLAQALTDDLAHGMQCVAISYAHILHRRTAGTGTVFEGAFKAKRVEQDEHLVQLSAYIHANPLRAGLVARPEDWPYSSYADYVGLRKGTLPQPAAVLQQFPSVADYREFVEGYNADRQGSIGRLLWE